MSILVDLPPELEAQLAEEAARLKLPLSDYVVRILTNGGPSESMPNCGAELVEYWRKAGVIGSRSDISDPAVHARQIRRDAENRKQSYTLRPRPTPHQSSARSRDDAADSSDRR